MYTPKTNLINILRFEFENNPQKMDQCLKDSHMKLKNQLTNRVFDTFPLLLPNPDFSLFKQFFKQILCSPTQNKMDLKQFEKDLAKIACEELLEANGVLKNDLIEMLKWPDYADKMDTYQLICAYVGVVNSYVTSELSSDINEKQDTFTTIMQFVNPNYGKWVLEVMRDLKMPYHEKYDTEHFKLHDLLTYPVRNPLFAFSLFGGGLIGAGLYLTAQYFKGMYDERADLPNTHVSKNIARD